MFKSNYGQICSDLRLIEYTLESNRYNSNRIMDVRDHIEYFETIEIFFNDEELMKFHLLKEGFRKFMDLKSTYGTLDKEIIRGMK